MYTIIDILMNTAANCPLERQSFVLCIACFEGMLREIYFGYEHSIITRYRTQRAVNELGFDFFNAMRSSNMPFCGQQKWNETVYLIINFGFHIFVEI